MTPVHLYGACPAVGYFASHELHASGTYGPSSEPALPGHHELRSRDRRAHVVRNHGQSARGRSQLLRLSQRLRPVQRTRRYREDRRTLVRTRRRPTGTYGARDQAVRGHGELAQRRAALRAATSAGHATPPYDDCRPTTSTSTRCTTSTEALPGTRSGKPWRCCATRARSSTSARPTSRDGTSPPPRVWRAHRKFMGLVSEQSLYNLLARQIELEVLPAAAEFGVGIIPWSPLQSGLLGGVVRKEREGSRRNQRWAEASDALQAQLEAYEELCESLGEEPATVALAWLFTRPAVTAPIIGPRTMEQFEVHCARWRSRWTKRRSRRSTPSSPATALLQKTTPGRRRPSKPRSVNGDPLVALVLGRAEAQCAGRDQCGVCW